MLLECVDGTLDPKEKTVTTMLDELKRRLDAATTQGAFREHKPKVSLHLKPYRVGDDDEQLNWKELDSIGDDYIEVGGELIDRSRILGVMPINF